MANVKFSGPLFEAGRRDAAFRRASRKGMSRAGAQIEATVKLNTPSDSGAYKGAALDVVMSQLGHTQATMTLTYGREGRERRHLQEFHALDAGMRKRLA